MKKHAWWACVVDNAITITCFTILALVFGKWWIALFSLLFMSTVKSSAKNYRICDGCGRHSPYADSHNEALEKAAAEGWITRRNGDNWEDFCPECRKKMEERP